MTVATQPHNNRDKLSNGTHLGFNMQTKQGRRLRHLVQEFTAAARAKPSEVVRTRIRLLAMLTVKLDAMMADMAIGKKVSNVDLAALGNQVSKIMLELGITREDR